MKRRFFFCTFHAHYAYNSVWRFGDASHRQSHGIYALNGRKSSSMSFMQCTAQSACRIAHWHEIRHFSISYAFWINL
jgi:hypothetical protein